MKSDDIVTIEEAAGILEVGRRMMYYLLKDRDFPEPFLKAGRKLWWRKDIEKYREKRKGSKQ